VKRKGINDGGRACGGDGAEPRLLSVPDEQTDSFSFVHFIEAFGSSMNWQTHCFKSAAEC
jgi:hypothetical protein